MSTKNQEKIFIENYFYLHFTLVVSPLGEDL